MPTKVTKGFRSWSFSALEAYELCPFKQYLKAIERYPLPAMPPSPALVRGAAVDDAITAYLLRKTDVFPAGAESFKKEIEALRAMPPGSLKVQEELAFTRQWEPCGWKDWDVCWVRVKTDLLFDLAATKEPQKSVRKAKDFRIERHIWDWKTGKIREVSKLQMRLYCLSGLIISPAVKVVHAKLAYLDQGEERDASMTSEAVEAEKAYWEARVAPMFADRKFIAKPSRLCQWCDYSRSKLGDKGPCKF